MSKVVAVTIRLADNARMSVEVRKPKDTAPIWLETGCEVFILPYAAISSLHFLRLPLAVVRLEAGNFLAVASAKSWLALELGGVFGAARLPSSVV